MSSSKRPLGRSRRDLPAAADAHRQSLIAAKRSRAEDAARINGQFGFYRKLIKRQIRKSIAAGYLFVCFNFPAATVSELYDAPYAYAREIAEPLRLELEPLGYTVELQNTKGRPVLRVSWELVDLE